MYLFPHLHSWHAVTILQDQLIYVCMFKVKEFLHDVIRHLELGPDGIRVAVVGFGSVAGIHFGFLFSAEEFQQQLELSIDATDWVCFISLRALECYFCALLL